MRIFIDTSVLVAAMVEAHPHHLRALPYLQRITAQTDIGIVASHSVVEVYAILTRLPLQPRISPHLAQQLITQNIINICKIATLTEADYQSFISHVATYHIQGGATYDALILHMAAKAGVDQVITFNGDDFRRVYPTMTEQIREPEEF